MDRTSYAFFFFNDTATTEIYTLSLHDALPILALLLHLLDRAERLLGHATTTSRRPSASTWPTSGRLNSGGGSVPLRDRKSTRLNSSHGYISYAVFCLKKNNTQDMHEHYRPYND